MAFYSAHVRFLDGSSPWVKYKMTRNEYGKQMKQWWKTHYLRVEKEEQTSDGNWLIFFLADKKENRG